MEPLHTIYRRIGFIYHRLMAGHADLTDTIDCHLAILDAVAR
jgi:DNA-binding GntR family transcriptional regulator